MTLSDLIFNLSMPNREALVILAAVLFFSVMMWAVKEWRRG
jgi:hypothetical protein